MALTPTERLEIIGQRVNKRRYDGTPASEIIAELVEYYGASWRTSGHTNVLRCAGVVGTCTSCKGFGLIDSWLRAARRRLEKAGAA